MGVVLYINEMTTALFIKPEATVDYTNEMNMILLILIKTMPLCLNEHTMEHNSGILLDHFQATSKQIASWFWQITLCTIS